MSLNATRWTCIVFGFVWLILSLFVDDDTAKATSIICSQVFFASSFVIGGRAA